MKVGGNESATKYFQSHGGSAALASKDHKAKYTSNAATKYKEELARRCATDARAYPDEVVITDVAGAPATDASGTPAGEDDDFFSSWDKPAVKRPSNPPSRTGTPRVGSPFLKPAATANGTDRPKSPLVGGPDATTPAAVPAAKPSARKTTAGAAPKKNILGAKKKGLGAKKVVAADGLDFDEAERKAREEAERIEKLGYDPVAEAAEAAKSKAPDASSIVAPTPVVPARAGFGTTAKPDNSSQDVERLGMGVQRLGFGQVGAGAKKPAAQKKMGGFGSVGKPVQDESEKYAREKFGTQKGISSDEFFGRNAFDPSATAQAKERLSGTSMCTPAPGFLSAHKDRLANPHHRLRRRNIHLLQRLLWPSRRRQHRGRLWRPRGRRQGFCPQVRHHGGRRFGEPVCYAWGRRDEAAGRDTELHEPVVAPIQNTARGVEREPYAFLLVQQ